MRKLTISSARTFNLKKQLKEINRAKGSRVVGVGAYRPNNIVTNQTVAKFIDSSDDWIKERSGIIERRFADNYETVVEMGIKSSLIAINESGIDPKDIDLVILATATNPSLLPNLSMQIAYGVGAAKAAGNYGAAMYATAQAKQKGYDQVLWTDPFEHKYVQECGTMNVFFVIGDTAITPDLGEGTILAGVTRLSVIELLKEQGLKVEERSLGMDEIMQAYKAGQLREVFGTGTAATISLIKELCYKEVSMKFDVDSWTVAPGIKQKLNGIREGRIADNHSWMVKI